MREIERAREAAKADREAFDRKLEKYRELRELDTFHASLCFELCFGQVKAERKGKLCKAIEHTATTIKRKAAELFKGRA